MSDRLAQFILMLSLGAMCQLALGQDGDRMSGPSAVAGVSADAASSPAGTQTPAEASDDDGDGVSDDLDNCSALANSDQRDANGDGFGDACDADLNNDCVVDYGDLALLRERLFDVRAHASDLNGDGAVDLADVGLLKSLLYQPPGPSGLVGQCDPTLRFGDL